MDSFYSFLFGLACCPANSSIARVMACFLQGRQSPWNNNVPILLSLAKHRAKARADDRNPPSQDCSPHQAEKKHRSHKGNKTENAKNDEIRSQRQTCTQYDKESHTAIIDPVLTRIKIKKHPANREKAEIPNLQKQVRQYQSALAFARCFLPKMVNGHSFCSTATGL